MLGYLGFDFNPILWNIYWNYLKVLGLYAIQISEIFIESTLKFSHLCVLNYLDSAIAETAILVFISI